MTYIGDLKLDSEGNAVIQNGDLAITDNEMGFIVHSLLIEPGSWRMNPVLGLGLERYIGEMNTVKLRNRMRSDLKRYFNEYNIDIGVSVIPINEHAIICDLNLLFDDITTTVTFDLESGVFIFPSELSTDSTDEEIQETNTRESTNKYISRR